MRFVLIHGYSGQPADLEPLAKALDALFGPGCAEIVALHPHWAGGPAPAFDEEAFLAAITSALRAPHAGPLVVVGHSTGGSLALLAMEGMEAGLLVLLATPPRVDLHHHRLLENATRPGNAPPSLLNVSRLVHAIRGAGRKGLPGSVPVLVVQGGADALVPAEDLRHWPEGTPTVLVPEAGHDLGSGESLGPVLEAILAALPCGLSEAQRERLRLLEPAVARYADAIPGGWRALERSPSALRALGLAQRLGPFAPPPGIANIEITTRCPHSCPSCARAFQAPDRGDLAPADFQRILAGLPHAARITLVGLGEPTLHRELPALVALAAREGRTVGLVTSGAALTPALAQKLVEAGLGGITFSLDAADPDLAAQLRPGVPLGRTLSAMAGAAAIFKDRVPLAVFTAACVDNARHLDAVADAAQALGAKAWMLSDLNFAPNRDRSLASSASKEDKETLGRTISRALAAGLPVLDVRGLEELGKPFRLREYLLRPADRLWARAENHASCLSPWQTAVVGADGTLTACDCQPDQVVGNVFETPFQVLWNGPAMRLLRTELAGGTPRDACRNCPRL